MTENEKTAASLLKSQFLYSNQPKCLVFESYDTKTYHLVGNSHEIWIDEKTAKKIADDTHPFELIDAAYNDLVCSDVMSKAIMKGHNDFMHKYREHQMKLPSAEAMKDKVTHAIFEKFKLMLKIHKPDSVEKFNDLMQMDFATVALSEAINSQIQRISPSEESLITMAMKLNSILWEYNKAFRTAYAKGSVVLTDRIFKDKSGAELDSFLHGMYSDILKTTIAAMDKKNQSMWVNFEFSLKEYLYW